MRLISFLNEKRTNAPRYILYHVTSLLLVLTLIIPSLSHGKVTGDFTPITTVTDKKSFLCYNPAAAVGSKEEMITKANLFTQIYGSLPAVSETVAGVVPVTNGVTDGWVLTKQSNGSAAWAATGASHNAVTLSTDLDNNILGLSTQQLTLDNQNINTVFAGPATGVPAAPAFRVLVAADVPVLNQNTTGSAATLTTARLIYGNSFNGSADLTQIISSVYGGTGNGFTKFSGPSTAEKPFTLPDADAVL